MRHSTSVPWRMAVRCHVAGFASSPRLSHTYTHADTENEPGVFLFFLQGHVACATCPLAHYICLSLPIQRHSFFQGLHPMDPAAQARHGRYHHVCARIQAAQCSPLQGQRQISRLCPCAVAVGAPRLHRASRRLSLVENIHFCRHSAPGLSSACSLLVGVVPAGIERLPCDAMVHTSAAVFVPACANHFSHMHRSTHPRILRLQHGVPACANHAYPVHLRILRWQSTWGARHCTAHEHSGPPVDPMYAAVS